MTKEERFWSHVRIAGDDECWEWRAARDDNGYGRCGFMGKTLLTHRVAFLISNGFLIDEMFVCHSCDNPPCCNPKHLFLGTHADNMQDMVSKGRDVFHQHPELIRRGERHWTKIHPERVARGEKCSILKHPELYRGEKHGMAKLTEKEVLEIREQPKEKIQILADRYNVSAPTVEAIRYRRLWKHI